MKSMSLTSAAAAALIISGSQASEQLFQDMLRTVVAKLNSLANRLFLAKVIIANKQ